MTCPMRETITEDVCRACGLCCSKGKRLMLTEDEVVTLHAGKTRLKKTGESNDRWDRRSEFKLLTDCGHRTGDGCAIHGTSAQPLVCRSFTMGGERCREMRAAAAE